MATHTGPHREILEAPKGPKVAAFFDVDRTLLAGFSAAAFIRERMVTGRMGPAEFIANVRGATGYWLGRTGFSGLVTASTAAYRGLTEASLEEIGEAVFQKHLATQIYPESRALIRAHRERGHTIAIVSSATTYQVMPFARELGVKHVLCTRLEVRDGAFTGQVIKPTCFGTGKREAAARLAAEHDLDLSQSFFYTDSVDDLPLLDVVGKPCPLNPDRRLAQIAKERSWPVRRFHSRGTPGAEQIVRTGLAYATLIPSVYLGAAVGLLNRSRREAVNVVGSLWGDLALAVSGVDLRVEGEEHLWSHRPAVFIFNHQSGLDLPLMLKLTRRDVTGVGKKELQRNPILGPLGWVAGAAFIDRSDTKKAIDALKPALDALHEGRSLMIAPEGTRQKTPTIGKFKKGAFHIAMQAGVPIVPVVFHNALDALPKNALVVRQATVRATVLPPIDVSDWRVEELAERIEEIREQYIRVLDGTLDV